MLEKIIKIFNICLTGLNSFFYKFYRYIVKNKKERRKNGKKILQYIMLKNKEKYYEILRFI